ncbi:MAG TPA: hypothetical protein EYP30_05340 [Archaeoglobaceae archaeon]|nr:hypothetical protein [Archaeoglobaceae archaeon]
MIESEELEENLTKLIKYELAGKEKLICKDCNTEIKNEAYFLVDLKADKVSFIYCEECIKKFRKEELAKHRKDVY